MVSVALLGIPIVRIGMVQLRTQGRTYKTQVCMPQATDEMRSELEQTLEKLGMQVTDLGEITTAKTQKITPDNYEEFGQQAERLINESEADVIIAVGGNHAAALPLYFPPGNAIRADAHGDAYVLHNTPLANIELNGGTYMYFVETTGLKKSGEIVNVGLNPNLKGKQYFGNSFIGGSVDTATVLNHTLPEITLFDIDLDVLDGQYALPHGHATSDLTVEALASLIGHARPKIVGVFECVGRDGNIAKQLVKSYENVFEPLCQAVVDAATVNYLENSPSVA